MSEAGTPKRRRVDATVSEEVREALARVGAELQAEGVTNAVYLRVLDRAGYAVSRASLLRWKAATREGRSPFNADKQGGRPRALTKEQRALLVGFILERNFARADVDRRACRAFLKDKLGVELHVNSVGRYLALEDITRQVSRSRTAGQLLTDEELVSQYTAFVCELRRGPVLKNLFASIDFTFTGHRRRVVYTYAPAGGPQPKSGSKLSTFTNCIVTMVWSDGVNRTPAVLFTYNGAFRTDRPTRGKGKRKQKWADEKKYVKDMMAKYGISDMRVVYIGSDKNESKTCVSEKADLVRRFFEIHDPPTVPILTDDGRAFKEKDVDVLKSLGYQRVVYPPAVHQYLSPNDNNLHGEAKAKWRAEFTDWKDDVKVGLRLLQLLDEATVAHSKGWFDRNFMLGGGRVTEKRVATVMSGGAHKKLAYLRDCHRHYRVKFMGAKDERPRMVCDNDCDLDGAYWQD